MGGGGVTLILVCILLSVSKYGSPRALNEKASTTLAAVRALFKVLYLIYRSRVYVSTILICIKIQTKGLL